MKILKIIISLLISCYVGAILRILGLDDLRVGFIIGFIYLTLLNYLDDEKNNQ